MTGAMFEVSVPPGLIVFAGPAPAYAAAMRRIFKTHGLSNVVMLTVDGARTWAVIVPDLVVCFTAIGGSDIVVEPSLVVVDPAQLKWSAPPDFAQPAIDATQDLLLRIAPAGRPQ